MGRPVTNKTIRFLFECVCGNKHAFKGSFPFAYNNLPELGIKRKCNKQTGRIELVDYIRTKRCNCSTIPIFKNENNINTQTKKKAKAA